MKVALLQAGSEEGIRRLLRRVREADLVVAPELALTGYEDLKPERAGEALRALKDWVGRVGIPVLLGHPVFREGRPYNGALLLFQGKEEVVAEKRVLFPGLDAECGFRPGEISRVFPLTEEFHGGVLICYELRFPELARGLVARGAGVIFVLARWPASRIEHLHLLARARAVENQVFVVVVNAVGTLKGEELGGRSMVVSPRGEILARAGAEETVLTADFVPEELHAARGLFNTSASRPVSSAAEKVKSLPELLEEVARRRKLGHRMVFTNGCFDLLHAGHVSYLEEARRLGDFLVVGLNSDASVRRLKGPERPVNPAEHRALVLAALSCVDYVVIFEEDTPERLIQALSPEVLVKGADWPEDRIVGADYVKARGGRVARIPFRFRVSTTRIIERIRRSATPDRRPEGSDRDRRA